MAQYTIIISQFLFMAFGLGLTVLLIFHDHNGWAIAIFIFTICSHGVHRLQSKDC